MLGRQQVKELRCAKEFAEEISQADPAKLEVFKERLLLLREAKQSLFSASAELASSTEVFVKTCPSTREQLDNESTPDTTGQKYIDLCRRIISSRIASQTILQSIPLSGVANLNKFVNDFADLKEGDRKLQRMQEKLNEYIQFEYGQAHFTLANEADKLNSQIDREGGASIDRTARRAEALASSPEQDRWG